MDMLVMVKFSFRVEPPRAPCGNLSYARGKPRRLTGTQPYVTARVRISLSKTGALYTITFPPIQTLARVRPRVTPASREP